MCGLHEHSRMRASGYACSGRMAVLSDQRDGKDKHVTNTTLGSYGARRSWVVLNPAGAQDLHVDAAIEHVFVNPCRLQEMLTSERSLW